MSNTTTPCDCNGKFTCAKVEGRDDIIAKCCTCGEYITEDQMSDKLDKTAETFFDKKCAPNECRAEIFVRVGEGAESRSVAKCGRCGSVVPEDSIGQASLKSTKIYAQKRGLRDRAWFDMSEFVPGTPCYVDLGNGCFALTAGVVYKYPDVSYLGLFTEDDNGKEYMKSVDVKNLVRFSPLSPDENPQSLLADVGVYPEHCVKAEVDL